ncbi:gustatory receptor for bitter taste 93a-like [Episyrphus balteatus]|uniref:gustatory receptor for bitter taste 93a-like n=1 Tax=Episyrphus balteatus TaxID=286459 RepID=UPI0024862D6C|nr:gustatory receptor for bitter taste 93a-like [Episyrphus balteatus]
MKFVFESKDTAFMVQNVLGSVLTHGTLVALDVICLVFITSSAMFRDLGLHLEKLTERIRKFETNSMTVSRRKKMVQEFCLELEECSHIYSEIFKATMKFHETVQLLLFLNFNYSLFSMITGIHVSFVTYLKFGEILWSLISLRTLQVVNLLILVPCVDLMVQRSKIPQNLDWESLYSEYDEQWDRFISFWFGYGCKI